MLDDVKMAHITPDTHTHTYTREKKDNTQAFGSQRVSKISARFTACTS